MTSDQLASLIRRRNDRYKELPGQPTIEWKLTHIRSKLMPFVFLKCEMTGFETSSAGYGVSFEPQLAATKAFCEAWERLCVRKFCPGVSSDGFAAGLNCVDAAKRSREEKIERAVMLTAWREQSGWEQLSVSGLKTKWLGYIFRLKGWKTHFYRLRSNVGTVHACVLTHSQKGAIFDCTFSASEDEWEEKLFLSTLRTVFLPDEESLSSLENEAQPSAHRRFYRNPTHLEAFEFLKNKNEPLSNIVLPQPERLETTVIVTESNFPAVCRATHPTWPTLTWGKQSIQGKNPWPHPLA